MKISKYGLNIFGFTLIIGSLFISASAQSLKERYLNPPYTSSTLDSGFTSWQWLSPLPQGNPLGCVQMIDSNTIVAVGDGGTFIKSCNAGKTWNVQHQIGGVTEYLTGVWFVNERIGTVVTERSRILHTTDGGITWSILGDRYFNGLSGVMFPSTDVGFVVGDNGVNARTNDGGISWFGQKQATPNDLYGVFFTSESTGIAVGEKGTICRTTDGGVNWISQINPLTNSNTYLIGVCFSTMEIGTVVGTKGNILRTTDGGISWVSLASGITDFLVSVSFSDSVNGLIVGFGLEGSDYTASTLRTTDGGNSWIYQKLRSAEHLASVSLANLKIGIAVGDAQIFLTTDCGQNWTTLSKGSMRNLIDICFMDSINGIAIGLSGTILRTTDGGISWVNKSNGSIITLRSIYFTDNETGIIVGDSGTILYTTDSGENWNEQLNPSSSTGEMLTGVWFVNRDTGIVIGDHGSILRTTNSGLNWVKQFSDSALKLYGISFYDSKMGKIVGEDNILLRGIIMSTTNGGINWTKQYMESALSTLRAISFIDTSEIVAVGGYSIIHTTNGGLTWSERSVGEFGSWVYLNDVLFIDSNNGIIVGTKGTILQTVDGGIHWKVLNCPTSNELKSVCFTHSAPGRVIYAVGELGTILCAAISPLNPRTWTWVGLDDSSWSNPSNWLPVGTPLPGDSIIIAQATHSPIIDSVQQQIVIASLNILSGGRLTITDALPRFVVLADVTVYGTLEIRPPAATTIIVGGNWTIQPGGSEERFAYLSKPNAIKLNDEGFVPSHSTVLFSGSGDMAGNFYNVMFDTASGMRSLGNIHVGNQCTMVGDISLRRNDTVFVTASFPQALVGPGKFLRGTIKRNIESNSLEPYNFESQSSFIKFDGSGTYPSSITITTFPDTTPSNFGNQWTVIPSRVDTATNTIVADSIKEFSKWVFGIPRPRVINDTSSIVQRVYEISAEGGSEFNGELSLTYDQTEVPLGLREDSLQLIRLEVSVDVKENVKELPKEFSLGQNYPNPFNPSTTIHYELATASHVTLKVYNVLGQEVATLVNEKREAGRYEVEFVGSGLTSGVYFYRFAAGGFVGTKKLLLLK